MNIKRIYVEKKTEFSNASRHLKEELRSYLGVSEIQNVRILNRYDIENVSEDTYQKALNTIFSDPPVDILYEERFPHHQDDILFSVEYLPGQFDQRADSAEQCIKLLKETEDPTIQSAVTYVVSGVRDAAAIRKIKAYCINPVDSREAAFEKPETLKLSFDIPGEIEILNGFRKASGEQMKALYDSLHLAMTEADFECIQQYFLKSEQRDPSITEIRVLDTYWSDHCRHTTFQTELTEVEFDDGYYKEPVEATFLQYLKNREVIDKNHQDKDICLMDLALAAMKKLKQDGKLTDLEQTEEINACSIVIPVTVAGETEEWLLNFKNETHNHPTEIEPFGGAATCLGGAVRDPLSGRTYVYQAMRITGAADPRQPLEQTLKGKLPQRRIVKGAADGYSSYGNQLGLATGYVKELYHPGYAAKRMEIGAVLGAAPRKHVIRRSSEPGDLIILIGGRTGRDGIGGATGSSKAHTETSIEVCGAEVQKGNPPTERKIQRLFRRPEVSLLIKKCNDFGAGGISVAIGELADGLEINLDAVPKKYAGLDGTELAISESQERMAVVAAPEHAEQLLNFAGEENLEAVVVAKVTADPRLVMNWNGNVIVDISREFLDTNGARQQARVNVSMPDSRENPFADKPTGDVRTAWLTMLSDLNCCSQKGLVEMFDSSIGAATVLMPYGGRYQTSEIQTMVAKLPVLAGECEAVSMMSYGFDPYLSEWSPYHGAVYAVLASVAKIAAAGGDVKKIHFTFQEYFKRMTKDPYSWGQPLAALLGAYRAQMELGLASIGGKDSMSGSFYDEWQGEIHVPPTLVSFAVCMGEQKNIISPELKQPGNYVIRCSIKRDQYDLPDFGAAMDLYQCIYKDIKAGKILSAYAVERFGIAAALTKMALGNRIGVVLDEEFGEGQLFRSGWGDLICEVPVFMLDQLTVPCQVIGTTAADSSIYYKTMQLSLKEAAAVHSKPLEGVFPTGDVSGDGAVPIQIYQAGQSYICKNKIAEPRVFIPVFPGTNCEYDSIKAFEKAGAKVNARVFKNLNADQIRESIEVYQKEIAQAQIVMFPGGFSAGDEPDGSAKFFAAAFRNEVMKEALMKLLDQRDGLILGICNGFQALIKLGLVPHGTISAQCADSPALTANSLQRHTSKMVYTKVVSDKSPWLQLAETGSVYCNPVSHGEGRFAASQIWLEKLMRTGQIATQYVDRHGNPTMDTQWNPNGSCLAIEGITSPDGRVLGKMAHSERIGRSVAVNICGEQDLKIFESGVTYFK